MCSLFIFILIFNILSVVCYASDESFVTKAVAIVKNKIKIPDNYTDFNSKVVIETDGQYAFFTWYGDDDGINSGGQLNVTVDEKLRIIEFSQYFYGNFKGNYKLSEYSSLDAQAQAETFIAKACPEFYPNTVLLENEYSIHRNFEPYEFKFVRYVNGLPCYDNYIDVVVNANNCKVSSFKVCWIDYNKIYPENTPLDKYEASVKMYDNFGMVKEYAKKPDGSLYIRYADLSDGVNYINAYTGNILNTNYVSQSGNYRNALTSQKKFDFWYSDNVFEIENVIKFVEENPYISLGADYNLTGIQYLEDNYSYYLYMEYNDSHGNKKTFIVDSVNLDIRYYDFYQHDIGTENHNYDSFYCENIAEAFLIYSVNSLGTSCRLLNYNNSKNYNGEDIYYYNFTRLINNIAYDSNGVVVGVSRSTGEVVSVRSGWDVIGSIDYTASISQGEAFEKYINTVGFELQYVTSTSMTKQPELRAVYAPNPLYEVYVDAISGEIIDKNGELISWNKTMYKDIAGDVSESQIRTLLACGILDADENFRPNENILLCDFLLWMCRAVDCIYYNSIYDVSHKLIDKGIVTHEEIAINPLVNTEKGIKYIISYLGYADIAELNDTFKTDFVDEGMISSDMLGYAAIAKGLKIFQGNAFMPKEYIKRNVAAQIFYNLISN